MGGCERSSVSYKFAFVMDPLENVLPDKDTTFTFTVADPAASSAAVDAK
jgi:hypothetical protein